LHNNALTKSVQSKGVKRMLRLRTIGEVPEETSRIAKASLPQGNRYIVLRDRVGVIYQDKQFADLFVWRGQPAESPGLLAMVTVMQFTEGLTDRQAAEAVGSRIDWKYMLGLEIDAPGLSHSVLSGFRDRLLGGGQEQLLLDGLVRHLDEQGWLKGRKRQRTDSTHVLAAIRELNRLEFVGETLRATLNDLAIVAPDWLGQQVEADWFERYGPRLENYRLPQTAAKRLALQQRIGQDGYRLLEAIYEPSAPVWLMEIPSVQVLRQVWVQQYYRQDDQVYIRTPKEYGLPPSRRLIQSPYDPEARHRTKRQTSWTGYAVHLTETCLPGQPHLITHCVTTPATTADSQVTQSIHQALATKGLLPEEHLVDTGYTEAELVLRSQKDHQLDLVGPLPANNSWQTKDDQAYDLACFAIDWERQQVTCPQGHQSVNWKPHLTAQGTPMIAVQFSRTACRTCDQRARCTKSETIPRGLTFRPQEQFQVLEAARQRQATQAFKDKYKQRAGIEGTVSQAVRVSDLRHTRYVGLAKTHLQHLATAAGINLARITAWLLEVPKAQTRTSRFMRLKPVFLT
jgi:transposase